jgi:TDG/mug DNA glycosylase family protein
MPGDPSWPAGLDDPSGAETGLPATLPERLGPRLEVVFVGINPSLYAVARGHYFARPQNRFWPAFSASRLSQAMRRELGVETLEPVNDELLPRFGFGLTDLVRRPTAQASHLRPAEYRQAAPDLRARLEAVKPKLVCFHGMMSYRPFLKHALGQDDRGAVLGRQPHRFAEASLWVVPNPSPANARYGLAELVEWYDRLHADLCKA